MGLSLDKTTKERKDDMALRELLKVEKSKRPDDDLVIFRRCIEKRGDIDSIKRKEKQPSGIGIPTTAGGGPTPGHWLANTNVHSVYSSGHCELKNLNIEDVLYFDQNLIHRYMVENMYRKVNEHIQPNLHCIDGNMTTPKISEGQNNNIENNVSQNYEDVLHFDHSDIHSEKNPSLKCMYTNTDSLTISWKS